MSARTETVYFACGSFWRKRALFAELRGVCATRVGYMGGSTPDPSATLVASGTTGHAEVVEVTFDTGETRFIALLKAFFSFHDATVARRANGGQYRSAVFCRKAKHRIVTERAIALLHANDLSVVTEVHDATLFWEAHEHAPAFLRRAATSLAPEVDAQADIIALLDPAALKRAAAPALGALAG